ncbi:MAG: tetratricopeptide repeat protein [Candidatus Alcyoniella australis]|nr:tetratricopeptide repeat protein [Candidatus Alcyoniella australis]
MRIVAAIICTLLCLTLVSGCPIKRQPRPQITPTPQSSDQQEGDADQLDRLLREKDADSLGRGAESPEQVEPPGPGVEPDQIFEQPRQVPQNRMSFEENLNRSSGQRRASNELVAQGRRSLASGNPPIAVSRFEKAIQVDPHNPFAYYYLAQAQFDQGRYDQTEPLASKAASYFGDDGFWLGRCDLLRAKALLARGETRAAYSAVQRSLSFDAANAEALELEHRLKLQLGIQ